MKRHHIEQAVVLAVGFVLGVALAIFIAPGDVFLWVLMGIVLGIFCREYFMRDWGGEMFGWFPRRRAHSRKTPVGRNS